MSSVRAAIMAAITESGKDRGDSVDVDMRRDLHRGLTPSSSGLAAVHDALTALGLTLSTASWSASSLLDLGGDSMLALALARSLAGAMPARTGAPARLPSRDLADILHLLLSRPLAATARYLENVRGEVLGGSGAGRDGAPHLMDRSLSDAESDAEAADAAAPDAALGVALPPPAWTTHAFAARGQCLQVVHVGEPLDGEVIAACLAPSSEGNQHQHLGAEHTFSHQEATSSAPTMSLIQKWRSPLGKCIDASPLIVLLRGEAQTADPQGLDADDRDDTAPALRRPRTCVGLALVGSHSRWFAAFDTKDGALRWKTLLDGRIEASANLSRSTRADLQDVPVDVCIKVESPFHAWST